MIILLEERTWLIARRGPRLFGFVHRTFLEYLCAWELAIRDVSREELRDSYVLPHIDDHNWHEVIRLLVAQVPPSTAATVISAICPGVGEAPRNGERLGLAWLAVAEVE